MSQEFLPKILKEKAREVAAMKKRNSNRCVRPTACMIT